MPISDTDWMRDGNCRERDPGAFFPVDGAGVQLAKQVCAECPVRAACLEYAIAHRIDHGVWGGESERSRVRIIRARRLAARTNAA